MNGRFKTAYKDNQNLTIFVTTNNSFFFTVPGTYEKTACFAMAQNVTSCLEIYDLQSRTHQVICEFPFLIEAPNWSPDGKWLLVNKEGRLYRIAPFRVRVTRNQLFTGPVLPGSFRK